MFMQCKSPNNERNYVNCANKQESQFNNIRLAFLNKYANKRKKYARKKCQKTFPEGLGRIIKKLVLLASTLVRFHDRSREQFQDQIKRDKLGTKNRYIPCYLLVAIICY